MALRLLLLLVLCPGARVQPPEAAVRSCSRDVAIRNGTFALSDGYRPGSLLTYSCPPGRYPHPARTRLCRTSGHWAWLPAPPGPGTAHSQPRCRVIRCPAQLAFENGSFQPRQREYPVGSELRFECLDGYVLRGPARRVCQGSGHWDGDTPTCDDGAAHCPNPGVPPGAVKTGSRYRLGDQVSYRCQQGLALVGSARRECTEAGEWSGAEPSCRAPFSFDLPEDVRAAFGASFSNILGLVAATDAQPQGLGRRLIMSQDSVLNVYLLVDSSKSVDRESFQTFKEWVLHIVDRIGSFGVESRFAVVSYASRPKKIVAIYDNEASDADAVMKKTELEMNFQDHGNGSGTNIYAALEEVYNMILFQREALRPQQPPEAWQKARHAIIVLTDGKHNVGAHPRSMVRKIEDVLDITPARKDFLDIYAFGVGTQDVAWEGLDSIASKKEGERHVFKLNSAEDLKATFDDILDPRNLGDTCGLGNNSKSASPEQQNPWHVLIKPKRGETCRGSLIADRWVLTAAHCFNQVLDTSLWRVHVGSQDLPIRRTILHPAYAVTAKAAQGIREYYDYDVALLELLEAVRFSGQARPICLPCTAGASRALKKSGSTCQDHERELLGLGQVPAHFISLSSQRLSVHIKTHEERPSCIAGAVQPGMIYENVSHVSHVVTDRFLCSGQTSGGSQEASTCKGESGGALSVEKRRRYFQVGVVSWGTYNPCGVTGKDGAERRVPPPPGHVPRDFYVSLFALQDWLRRELGDSVAFVPLHDPLPATCPLSEPPATPPAGHVSPPSDPPSRPRVPSVSPQRPPQPATCPLTVPGKGAPPPVRFGPGPGQLAAGRYQEVCLGLGGGSRPISRKSPARAGGPARGRGAPPASLTPPPDSPINSRARPLRPLPRAPAPPPPARPGSVQRRTDAMGPAAPLFLCLLLGPLRLGAAPSSRLKCDPEAAPIVGGSVKVQQLGQAVVYQCPEGQYPYPTPLRQCRADGRWSPLTARDGRLLAKAECRAIQCQAPQEFENGHFQPRQPRYNISQTLRFECFEGYRLEGPRTRTCQPNGKWSGSTAVCDDGSEGAAARAGPGQTDTGWAGTDGPGPGQTDRGSGRDRPTGSGRDRRNRAGRTGAPHLSAGNTNMGGSPEPVVAQIRELLSINRGREDYLDIYVFGIGALVNLQNLNALATHKSNEKHVFHMQNIQDLRKTFQEMIDESEVLSMCAWAMTTGGSDQQKHPWHVAIKIARPGKGQEICKGSLISPYYVLTAAHCFDINDEAQWISVDVGPQLVNKVEELRSHPQYHIGALRDKGIPEFYDYDVALVKLKKPVPFSPTVRPICLPCTEGATRALRKPHPETSCQHHERLLLPAGEVPALFVHEKVDRQRRKVLERKEVHIKNGPKKSACEADAKKALIYVNVTDVSQVVTPRFFCSGGIDPVVDPNTCKGDSGGPLIIHKGKRYFQVGVISWGVVDVCKDPQQQSPPYARDFHLNLFTVLPWLRKELAKEELGFM
ncbi:LOW QUALITY PROTEIN: transmembrane protease serine 9-like [Carettochelys insculpta]|uniref:LOW QUALITY PROTEIN: transmembrane protease serine 9-like n=1 Tax=Carettochelys insculpta TaxID=44489 RepID=UPI003EC0FB3E